jgi:hypothetical protein
VERVLEWTVAIKVARAKVRTSSAQPPQKRFVNHNRCKTKAVSL